MPQNAARCRFASYRIATHLKAAYCEPGLSLKLCSGPEGVHWDLNYRYDAEFTSLRVYAKVSFRDSLYALIYTQEVLFQASEISL